ncbi:MAG: transposase [Actinomycetes bacterium]
MRGGYGIGALTSVVVWCEMGDARRFARSRDAVRHAGLDITMYSSDNKALARAAVPPRGAAAAVGAV